MTRWRLRAISGLAAALAIGACVAGDGADKKISGTVQVDGSSTVAPITQAAAELFRSVQPKVRVLVGVSGTGGGFKKLLDDREDLRIDVCDASRSIRTVEVERATKLGVEFIEIPVALDGIVVVVNPKNKFCDTLTLEELKRVWEPGSKVNNWNQVRPTFPDMPIMLYGPTSDNGTFDYFTEVVVGKMHTSREDYTGAVTPNILVQGVAGDEGSLGYFGMAYYEANRDKVRAVKIDNGQGAAVEPSQQAVRTGAYAPLSRPLFLYVNARSATRPEVVAFVEFILNNGKRIVEHPRVGYVALSDELYQAGLRRLHERIPGTVFPNGDSRGKSLEQWYGKP